MIRMQTILEVADNSGARKIACIQPLGGSSIGKTAGLGDVISASVKEALRHSSRVRRSTDCQRPRTPPPATSKKL